MGVQGTFKYLESQGITGNVIDPALYNNPIHVDILSLYFAYIVSTMNSLQLRVFQTEADTSQTDTAMRTATLFPQLITAVHNKLQRSFSPSSVTLHFDGAPSTQKNKAHTDRTANFNACAVETLASVVTVSDTLQLFGQGLFPAGTNRPAPRSVVRRILRSYKRVLQLWRSMRFLDQQTKNALVAGLQALGWTVCSCLGEADVCIASLPGQATTAATSDSDFLFHHVPNVLRQDPNDKTSFRLYDTQQILQQLGITPNMWTTLAIVTNNDYTRNVRRYGLVTNLAVIMSLPNAPLLTPHQLLNAYCRQLAQRGSYPDNQTSIQSAYFQNAYSIYVQQRETLLAHPLVDRPDEDVREIIHHVNDFFAENRRLRRMRLAAPAPPLPIPAPPSPVPAPPSPVPATPVSGTLQSGLASMSISPSVSSASSSGSSTPSGSSISLASSEGDAVQTTYRQFMSSNAYSVHTYTRPPPAQIQTPTTAKRSKSKRAKRKQQPIYNPSSRRARATPASAAGQGGNPKSTTPEAILDSLLSSKRATISMNCGTLSTRLRSSCQYNPDLANLADNQRQQLARTMTNLIKEMVQIGTEATRRAQQAIALHIAEIMHTTPGMDNASIAARNTALVHYTGFHNTTFFKNILQDIFKFYERGPRKGRRRNNTAPANIIVEDIIFEYRYFLFNNDLEPSPLNDNIKGGMTHFFELAGARLGDQVQTHYHRNISELVSRLHRYDPAWCIGAEGANVLGTINNGISTVHDQVSLFWILNTRLPQHAQMAFFPESPFRNSFFNITELSLVNVVYNSNTRATLRPIKDFIGATKVAAERFVAEHPGELFHYLFFDKKLDYYRRTTVLATSPVRNNLQGRPVLKLSKPQKKVKRLLLHELSDDPSDAGNKHALRMFLDEHLITPAQHKEDLDTRLTRNKYVLTGTFSTNGHELKILAYSLTKPRPPAIPGPNTTRRKLDDVMTLDTRTSVMSVFPYNESFTVVGIDPGIHNTATATVINSENENTMGNISIPRSADAFCSKAFQSGLSRAKGYWNTVVTLPPGHPLQPLGGGSDQLLNVSQMEQSITPVVCAQAPTGRQQTWINLSGSIRAHVESVVLVQAGLRKFYSSRTFEMKRKHLKQARTATLDRGVTRLCHAAGLTRKVDDISPKPLFVVGDGHFGSRNTPVLHQRFISFLKSKVQALNGEIRCADEFRTSMVCCQCQTVGVLVNRAIECPGCNQTRDRDHNGATNIALATLSLLRGGGWPIALQRAA